MDSANSKNFVSRRPTNHHRLLFDRRYGWVIDEWKDPSKEALAGGRGMFCILPLAKAFLNTASQSVCLQKQSRDQTLFVADGLAHICAVDSLQDTIIFPKNCPIGFMINLAANFAVKVFERPDLFTPQAVKENLDQQLKKLNATLKKQEIKYLPFMDKFPSQTPLCPSHLQMKAEESQIA